MQEPIISEDVWERVQVLRNNKRRPTATGRKSLFSGLVYCPDCGAKLHFCASKSLRRDQEFFRCANYKSGRGLCKIHYIRDLVLEQIVMEAVSDISDEYFMTMTANYKSEQNAVDVRMLLKGFRKYSEMQKLTPEIVNMMIQRTEVHNSDKHDGHCHIKVDIYFTGVGLFEKPTTQELQTLADMHEQNAG